MAALTTPRNTVRRDPEFRDPVVAAGSTCYAGGIVVLDAGQAKPGRTATGLIAIGVAQATAAAGETVRTRRGCFRFDNSASTDAIAASDIGKSAYLVDDHTVAKTDGSSARSAAGKIFDVDAQGVWVEIG